MMDLSQPTNGFNTNEFLDLFKVHNYIVSIAVPMHFNQVLFIVRHAFEPHKILETKHFLNDTGTEN